MLDIKLKLQKIQVKHSLCIKYRVNSIISHLVINLAFIFLFGAPF